jgi:TP901 family phage tail tape measure protein
MSNNTTNITINLEGDVFVLIKELRAEFEALKKTVNASGDGIRDELKKIGEEGKEVNKIFSGELLNFSAIQNLASNFKNTIGEISKPGLAFESSMANLSAITGIAGEDLKSLGNTARQVGKDSGLGASQAAEAFKILASQISVDKMGIEGLKTLQKETITLAQAAGMDIPTAAKSMASAINQFGLEATDASRVINVFAAGSKYGAAEVNELAETFKVAGAAANAAGVNVESLAGVAEVLSKNAMVGSEAGTHLRNILVRMQTNLGVDFKKVPISEALKALQPELENTEFLVKTFGESSLGAAQFLIQNADYVDEMTKAVTGTNVAYEQAAINTDTYETKLAKIRATFDDVKISVFNMTGAFLPAIEVTAGVLEGISNIAPAVIQLTKGIKWLTVAKNRELLVTKFLTAQQWLLNIALNANPVGLVVAGIAALVAVVTLVIAKYDEWGAALSLVLGPLGMIINIIQSFRRHWDSIKQAFTDGGIVAGLKRIGLVLLDAILMPVQQLLEVLSKIPGLGGLAQKGADAINGLREKLNLAPEKQEVVVKEEGSAIEKALQTTTPQKPIIPTTDSMINNAEAKSSGAQGSARNNNIRIENLVRNFTINGVSLQDSPQKIKELVTEAFVAAVRDTEVAIS